MSMVDSVFNKVIFFFFSFFLFCINIIVMKLPTCTVAQLIRASEQQLEDLGSNPNECQIYNLFCHVLFSVLPSRSVEMPNFDRGLHNNNFYLKKQKK